jgi:hypothetical protein
VVGGEADDETSDLEAEGLVEVCRDVGVGPEFCWVEVLVWGLRENGWRGGKGRTVLFPSSWKATLWIAFQRRKAL